MALLRNVLRALGLVVGTLNMMYCGSALIYSIYTNAIKKRFNYTQSEIEVMSGIGNFGLNLGFVPGILMEIIGPRFVSLGGLILSGGGYFLLWTAARSPEYYSNKAGLQYIYIFFAYFGVIFSYMSAMLPNIVNFSPRLRGTIVSCLDAGFSGGASILVLVYSNYYVNGHNKDEENQDVGGFFFCMAITGLVINTLGIIFHGYYPFTEEVVISEEEPPQEEKHLINGAERLQKPDDITGVALFLNWNYQFILWIFIFMSSLQSMFINNVNVILKSFSMELHSTLFNVLVPVAGVLAKLFCGIISDRLINVVSRPLFLLIFNVLQTAVFAVSVRFAGNYEVLLVTTLITGLANGAIWSLTPTLISEFFGTKYFGRNWGLSLLGGAFGALLFQKVFGIIYEAEISEPGETFCYGFVCFEWSFVMAAVISGCSVILNIGIIERNKAIKEQSDKT